MFRTFLATIFMLQGASLFAANAPAPSETAANTDLSCQVRTTCNSSGRTLECHISATPGVATVNCSRSFGQSVRCCSTETATGLMNCTDDQCP